MSKSPKTPKGKKTVAKKIMFQDTPVPPANPTTEASGSKASASSPWSFISKFIKCQKHSVNGSGKIKSGDIHVSWEWRASGLNCYVFGPSAILPPWFIKLGENLFAAADRYLESKPHDTAIALGVPQLRVQEGILILGERDANPDEFKGTVLVWASSFYVITGGRAGEPLPEGPSGLCSPPIVGKILCPLCVDGSDGQPMPSPESVSSVRATISNNALTVSSGEENNMVIDATNVIRQVVPPAYEGDAEVSEWKDYWGTTYDKYVYPDWTFVKCRDVSIFAGHTVGAECHFEIYPDVCTRLQTVRLTTASNPYACIYTDAKNYYYRCARERQTFLLLRGSRCVVAHCYVIATKAKLMSGQCIYYWTAGMYPYRSQNVRVGSVVTVARQVNGVNYYAVMNGSAQYYEFSLNQYGTIRRAEYTRDRVVASDDMSVYAMESEKFKHNKMVKLLNSRGQIVCSWTQGEDVDYDPSDYVYCALPRVQQSSLIPGPTKELEEKIIDKGGLAPFLRHLETGLSEAISLGETERPTVMPMLAVGGAQVLRENCITVNIARSDSPQLISIGGRIIVRTTKDDCVISVSNVVNKLWSLGFSAINLTGELELLFECGLGSVSLLFSGAEKAPNPLLIFVHQETSVLQKIEKLLMTAIPDSANAFVKLKDMTFSPDLRPGCLKYRTQNNSNRTLKSLREWRNTKAVEPVKLEFDLTQVSTEVASVDEVCDVSPGEWWTGKICSALDQGMCFGDTNRLVTSYHVTHGCPVVVTRAGLSHTWEDPFHTSEVEDLVMYGAGAFDFAKAEVGEILCIACPSRRVGKFLVVETVRGELENRRGALFYEMRPVDIDDDYSTISPSSWKGIQGMSGSPIVNSSGKIVSVYGLGRLESRPISSVQRGELAPSPYALTIMAPDASSDVSPDNYFKTAVYELLKTDLPNDKQYFLVEAPTGSGKTMNFTSQLLRSLPSDRRVYLLQPTVAAVRGAYEHLVRLLDVQCSGASKYTITYVVGQQHEDHTETVGQGNTVLLIMSYGTAIRRSQEIITRADFLLLDEIHCRGDPTVVAGDLQFTVSNRRYKCVHLTATVLTRTGAFPLASGLEITGTRFPISEDFKMTPICKGKEPEKDSFLIPPRVIGTRHEAYGHGYVVPMAPISKGRVIFFCSSRADCENLCKHAAKKMGDSRGYVVIHGGTTFDVAKMPEDCWCFCTDVVGQAVTVPGCVAVIDFLEEVKPKTRLEFDGNSLLYNYTLGRRIIGEATSKQRKGRTGRTNSGFYITPAGISPREDYQVDQRTAAVAMLELEAAGRFYIDELEKHHNRELVSTLKNLSWILPKNLTITNWWRKVFMAMESVQGVKKGVGKRFVSNSLKGKLDLVRDVSGDIVYLYLTPLISEELILFTRSTQGKTRTASLSDDDVWYGRYFDYAYLCGTERQRDEILTDLDTQISSFVESPDQVKDVDIVMLSEMGLTPVSTADILHSAPSFIGGVAVATGACAVIMSSIYNLTIRNLTRYVTEVYPFRTGFASSHCRYLADGYRTDPDTMDVGKTISGRALEVIRERKDSVIKFFAKIGIPIASGSKDQCFYYTSLYLL